MCFVTVPEALEQLKQGRVIVVTDDEDRENEGDFIAAAELTTPEIVNFMATHGRGMICVPATGERITALNLPLMVNDNTALHGTAFTVSVDYIHNTTTGISAADRAATIRAMADPVTKPEDLARPGHIHPLRAAKGGVLRRVGHTEATVDLMRMAGLRPAGVLCEIMEEDGSMARQPRLKDMAREFGLVMVTVRDIIEFRSRSENLVHAEEAVTFPTKYGKFTSHCYTNDVDDKEHIALVCGEIDPETPTLVRVHSECLTGDALHSLRCDCGAQLDFAMEKVGEEGGVVLYMRQEGRGIGLRHKMNAYRLQDEGLDTVEANEELGFKADERDYGIGAQILVDLGVKKMRLMTNNPDKMIALEGYGLEIVERIPIQVGKQMHNERYLDTKRDKMGHML